MKYWEDSDYPEKAEKMLLQNGFVSVVRAILLIEKDGKQYTTEQFYLCNDETIKEDKGYWLPYGDELKMGKVITVSNKFAKFFRASGMHYDAMPIIAKIKDE